MAIMEALRRSSRGFIGAPGRPQALVEPAAPRSRWRRRARDTVMPPTPIPTEAFEKIAVGIDRPEDVVVGKDGRVFASDHRCAVAEIFADGSFRRLGPKGGAPNGLNMDCQGRKIG